MNNFVLISNFLEILFKMKKGRFDISEAQFRRRASALPNLIVIGSTVARCKHDSDPDVVPNSGLTEVT